ncbi:MAG: methyl-accepting chemotaxis protein [Turicibacter sp.]|nr:methyl-accepting chemotaxis protein [Turicibacter sp.]
MLKNVKIRPKIILGFVSVLIIAVFISIFSIVNITNMNNQYVYIFGYPNERLSILNVLSGEIMHLRYTVLRQVFYEGPHGQTITFDTLESAYTPLFERIDAFRENIMQDPSLGDEERNIRYQNIETMRTLLHTYINTVMSPIIEATAEGDSQRVGELLLEGDVLHWQMVNLYAIMTSDAQQLMDNSYDTIVSLAATTIVIMSVAVLLGLIVCVIVSIIIPNLVVKPMAKIVDALENVSEGNLNVNIKVDGNDEIATLSRSTKRLTDIINSLMSDLEIMSREHERGDIEVFIDSEKYVGAYKSVVEQINLMTLDNVDMTKKAMEAIEEISRGNFTITLEEFPHKKAYINRVFDRLKKNVTNVSTGISGMIKAASIDGNLAYSIDEEAFEGYGDWLELVKGLNKVCRAVDEPITEIRDIMGHLIEGIFNKKVEGNYSGDFAIIKEGVNGTVDALNGYIKDITTSLAQIAAGDLTHNISSEYVGDFKAIKESINDIVTRLHKTISEINSASFQLLTGVSEISSSAMDLASGATEQAGSIEELSASVDLIKEQTSQNADNAENANGLSAKSSENAMEGNAAMRQMLEAMLQIKESSNNISRIIKVIQDISFQTNLLSLNAAVEAARAGEHGKGFNVVAEEVRSLANRSQQAASETTTLIEDSISRVEIGSDIAETTAESLELIMSNASEVLDIINNITISSREQSDAIAQVSLGLSQISQVVQSNSAVSEQTAAAAEELNSQATLLQQMVSYFKL